MRRYGNTLCEIQVLYRNEFSKASEEILVRALVANRLDMFKR
jgi:hypothetical protein